MAKYRCTICGYIYDEEKEEAKFEELPDSWNCHLCGVPKSLFEKTEEEIKKEDKLNNAVKIDKNNPAIERIESKCVNCGACKTACEKLEGIDKKEEKEIICVYCGQCLQACPTGAIIPKRGNEKIEEAKRNGKICIAYIAPAVRVAIGEEFRMEYRYICAREINISIKKNRV